ncbi:MAG: ABC transporter substrate-binding protein, partial [Acidimicrobiales bacterium]
MTSPSRAGAGLVLLLAGALGLAACQGGAGGAGPGAAPQPTTTTTAAPGGSSTTARPSPDALRNTATFAEPAGTRPDFIFPVTPKGYGSTANTRQLSSLMWRPLVWSGTGEQVGVNDRKSLFQSIAYSSDGKTVTIVLKDWSWSDGQPVSSRDVTFFLDLVKANETQWSRYSPGQLPDDIVSWRAAGQRTVVLTLDQAYSRFWFTDDELALVTPLPQHAWDRESARGPVGSFDQTAAGARKVWRFLVGEARDTATFATNPLWRVVDGPWQLRSFSSAGKAVFEPNPAYSGPDAPSLSRFVELPFATSAAELAALESGRVDVGYLPTSHLGEEQVVGLEDYRLTPWVGFSVSFVVPDLANPAVGPLLQQLYVRQALQHLVDQQAIVADAYGGYASPTYGPVPLAPPNPYASPAEAADPYPFSVSDAAQLLSSHGWQVTPGGPDT